MKRVTATAIAGAVGSTDYSFKNTYQGLDPSFTSMWCLLLQVCVGGGLGKHLSLGEKMFKIRATAFNVLDFSDLMIATSSHPIFIHVYSGSVRLVPGCFIVTMIS